MPGFVVARHTTALDIIDVLSGLMLERGAGEVPLADWAAELVAAFEPMAQALDAANATSDYGDALRSAKALIEQPDLLPSARVLEVMEKEFGNSFLEFGIGHSTTVIIITKYEFARDWR